MFSFDNSFLNNKLNEKGMESGAINLRAITKSFGQFKVLDNVTLSVDHGDIFCLLGPNGSGKTTMINCILSLLEPDSGSIRIFGSDDLTQAKKSIGVLLEEDGFFKDLNAWENLKVICLIKGIGFNVIPLLLEKFDLLAHRKKKVSKFSQGMRRRLALASSLIGDPDLVIWDEPYNGLDPSGFRFLRDLIMELKEKGKTLFISTHLLDEVMKTSGRVGLIFQGEIREVIPIDKLTVKYKSMEDFYFHHINDSALY